jgi:hypothetical protein
MKSTTLSLTARDDKLDGSKAFHPFNTNIAKVSTKPQFQQSSYASKWMNRAPND